MSLITRDYLQGIQALVRLNSTNSLIDEGSIHLQSTKKNLETDSNSDKFDEYYFQILTFDLDDDQVKSVLDLDDDQVKSVVDMAQPKLICGKKKHISTFLALDSKDNLDSFPSKGAKIKDDFVKRLNGDDNDKDLEKAQFATIRFLLQSRLLSQLFSYTWLDKIQDEKKIEIKLVRKILDSYNIIPEAFSLDEGNNTNSLSGTFWTEQEKNSDNDYCRYLIHPEYVSYSSISLALLLSGHAYYKLNNEWKRVYPAIFSNYEIVYEYQLDISWDTFYASRIDISQSGKRRNFPFTKVTFGYPPRPSEFSLPQSVIEEWVTAQEEGNTNERLNFYLNSGSNKEDIGPVVPPYPYLPLSSC